MAFVEAAVPHSGMNERATQARNPIPPANEAGMEVVSVDANHAIGVWRNDILVVWRGETQAAAIDRVRGVLTRVYQQEQIKLGLLQYVAEGAPLPFNKEVRESIAKMLQEARTCVACSAMVAPGTGFRIATGRAIVTGITMLARPGFPHVIFPTLEEAAIWQTRLLPQAALLPFTTEGIISRVYRLLHKSEAKSAGPAETRSQELRGP